LLTACHRKLEARLDGLMRVLELLQTSPGDRLDAAAGARTGGRRQKAA
jgi:hypothetical protein